MAARKGDLERLRLLCEGGADKNQVSKRWKDSNQSALAAATEKNHFEVVQYLVGQGADKEQVDNGGSTPLIDASFYGYLEIVRYLLEQGANRDKRNNYGWGPLHYAAQFGRLEIAKVYHTRLIYITTLFLTSPIPSLTLSQLLMSYGADLNARDTSGRLPIDVAHTEEMEQAIRDEPRRRMDHGHKRATEQDRHHDAAAEEEVEHLVDGLAEEGKVAEEDEDSEPSDEEDD